MKTILSLMFIMLFFSTVSHRVYGEDSLHINLGTEVHEDSAQDMNDDSGEHENMDTSGSGEIEVEAGDDSHVSIFGNAGSETPSIHDIRAHARNNFNVAERNFVNIVTRLSSRIEKVRASGADMTGITKAMVSAQASFEIAKTKIAAVNLLLSNDASTKDAVVRAAADARNALMEARRAFLAVVQSIKDAIASAHIESGTSADVSTQ